MDPLSGKSVLVTGASGFIGSHLSEMLTVAGAHVRALCEYNSFNDWGWLEGSPALDSIEIVTGDIRDPHCCQSLMKGIDVVLHLAALIPIPYSYRSPDSFVDTNVRGTLNLCQAAREQGTVQRFVQTSTSEVYGTALYVPIDEAHPLQGQSPYSATKIGADAIALSFYYSFGLPVTIARPFNTYGPRQSARAVIPTIIAQVAGQKVIQLGDTRSTRDFTFVTDTVRGLMTLAGMDCGSGEVFNIGSNQEISIGDLFCKIAALMGSDAQIAVDNQRLRPEKSEVLRLWCDNRKMLAATGFAPRTPLEEGLQQTIEWLEKPCNLSRYKPALYNV